MIAVTAALGSRADVIDGTTVRVTIDWASCLGWPGPGGPMGQVAHGVYIVSNGYGQSRARWTVWYMPEMRV